MFYNMNNEFANFYQFLVKDFDFTVEKEVYDPVNFGNRYALLKSDYLVIRYVLDRSQIRIEFANILESQYFFDSDLVIALIENVDSSIPNMYSPDQINTYICSNMEKIRTIFSEEFMTQTKIQLKNLANERFFRYFK